LSGFLEQVSQTDLMLNTHDDGETLDSLFGASYAVNDNFLDKHSLLDKKRYTEEYTYDLLLMSPLSCCLMTNIF
jgi:hypothetical protein